MLLALLPYETIRESLLPSVLRYLVFLGNSRVWEILAVRASTSSEQNVRGRGYHIYT